MEVGRRASGGLEGVHVDVDVDVESSWEGAGEAECSWEADTLRRELECTKRGVCERVRWEWNCERPSRRWRCWIRRRIVCN